TYSVTLIITNAGGSDTLSAPSLIILAAAPSPPVVTATGDTVWSSHSDFYQWYFNGVPIAAATDSFYVATQTGTYSVRGTDAFGCTGLSNGIYVNITSVTAFINGDGVTIYPNPAREEFTVYGLRFTVGATLELYDVLGMKVYSSRKD